MMSRNKFLVPISHIYRWNYCQGCSEWLQVLLFMRALRLGDEHQFLFLKCALFLNSYYLKTCLSFFKRGGHYSGHSSIFSNGIYLFIFRIYRTKFKRRGHYSGTPLVPVLSREEREYIYSRRGQIYQSCYQHRMVCMVTDQHYSTVYTVYTVCGGRQYSYFLRYSFGPSPSYTKL